MLRDAQISKANSRKRDFKMLLQSLLNQLVESPTDTDGLTTLN